MAGRRKTSKGRTIRQHIQPRMVRLPPLELFILRRAEHNVIGA